MHSALSTKIGIYGGSFNPIHIGHTQLGVALCHMGMVDELWFVVSPMNPLKQDISHQLLPDAVRLHLAQLAVNDIPQLHVSDIEMHMPRPSYMADTLQRLRSEYPQAEFLLVIGSDNWLSFHRWSRPDEILRHHRIIVYPRPGYEVDASTLPHGVTLADTPLIDISSTQIRQAIHNGTCNGKGLPPAVWQEIQTKAYYK